MKWTHAFGAATAIALALAVGACGGGSEETAAPGAGAERIATAPDGQVMAPGALTRTLGARGFRPTNVRRRGSQYVVDATGPSGNQVRMVVDGRRGQIRGMDVLRWAPGQRRIARGSRGAGFVNDAYEFGVTLEDAMLAEWVVYDEAQWTSEEAWIEYEEVTEEWEWSEITYEESIEEVSYEAYEEEYGEVTEYEESFYEEETWEESYGEEELSYESEEEFEEELTEEYGEEYAEEYEEYDETYSEESSEEESYEEEAVEEEAVEEESYEEEAVEEESYEEEAVEEESYDDGGGDEGYDDGGGEEY